MKNLNILITGAGGPAAICAFKSLSKSYFKIHMADMDLHSAGLYFVPSDARHLLPPASAENYLKELFKICLENKIEVLIPTVDAELIQIAKWKDQFEAIGTRVLTTDVPILELCMNKYHLLSALSEQVDVGQFGLLKNENAEDWKGKPVIVKPITGSGSRGVQKYDSFEEIPDHLRQDESILIQEFYFGIEYSADVMVSTDHEIKALVLRQRLRTDSGVSVTGKVVKNQQIEEYITEIIRATGITYAANIQVIFSPIHGPRLVEINPRFSGGLSLVIEAGADTPRMAVRELMGWSVDEVTDIVEIAMVRSYHETYMLAEELS